MSSLMTWCLILGIACCVAAISNVEEAQIRVRRRVKPRPKKPLTLEELNYECQMHGWTSCRDKTTELLSAVSNFSIDHRKCLNSAVLSRVSSLTVDPLAPQVVADDPPPVAGVNEAITTGSDLLPQTPDESSESCTLDSESKEIARRHYCSILTLSSGFFVHNYMEDDMYNRGLTGLADCVNYYPSNEIFTPQELITSLKAWYSKMVRRHDCCETYQNFFPLPEQQTSYPCPASMVTATHEWDKLLTGVATIMKKVELLGSLGRRRQCLRGCVGIEEVKCCDII